MKANVVPGRAGEILKNGASYFDRARKQEIDALKKQDFMNAAGAGIDASYAEITRQMVQWNGKVFEFKQGECPPDCQQAWVHTHSEPDDDGPESYEELLDACSCWDDEAYNTGTLEDIETCHANGDEALARLLREREDHDARIAEHARAMQAARKRGADSTVEIRKMHALATERPGVMIKADYVDRDTQDLKGLAGWLPAVGQEDAVARKAYGIPPTAERTCTTCSKTCDVGAKCWWCGNV